MRSFLLPVSLTVVVLLQLAYAIPRAMPRISQQSSPHRFENDSPPRPSANDCAWQFFNQTLDHFNQGNTPGHDATFLQRYCVVDRYWRKPSEWAESTKDEQDEDEQLQGPIFFYTGNESPVEEYVNNTGLIWELAPKFGALIVFAEHRYEGESVPKMEGMPSCLSYCSSMQAIADYATLITFLRTQYGANTPLIAFGGSYGGMLSAYLRTKFPALVHGAIAASAPVWGLPLVMKEEMEKALKQQSRTGGKKKMDVQRKAESEQLSGVDYRFGLDGGAVAITRGLEARGGATDQCRDNLRFAWPLIRAIGATQDGRDILSSAFSLCTPLRSTADVEALISWGTGPWFNLAEGNYPFPSTYITFAVGPGIYPLPAWPMRVACSNLDQSFNIRVTGGNVSDVSYSLSIGSLSLSVDWDQVTHPSFSKQEIEESGVIGLMQGVREAVAVWYNVTGTEQCFQTTVPPSSSSSSSSTSSSLSSSASDVCKISQKGSWGPLCCNDNLNLVNYITMGTGRDIYWPPTVSRGVTVDDLVNRPGSRTSCEAGYASMGLYGVPAIADPWSVWFTTFYAGNAVRPFSNIVFSNGLLDPWSSAGVYGEGGYFAAIQAVDESGGNVVVQNVTQDGSIAAVVMSLGGHHLDLFFSTPEDPPCAVQARQVEAEYIAKWIKEAYSEMLGK